VKRRVYVDTSAYLCVLLGEEGAAAVAAQLEGANLQSSVLLVLEARRNLVRLVRNGQLATSKLNDLLDRVRVDAELFTLRDLTADLCFDPAVPAMSTPRSLDLAHLRTALWFHRREPLHAYVTRDSGQREAARELGLPVA
jgi:hypothetical protein